MPFEQTGISRKDADPAKTWFPVNCYPLLMHYYLHFLFPSFNRESYLGLHHKILARP